MGEPAADEAVQPQTPAPVKPEPVAEAQRLRLIDALRGIALLGILLMNIPGFAMPNYFSESFRNDPSNVNFWVSHVIGVVFEGKMRALFGMIFGAGVLLFVLKKERTGKSVTWLFYRRMMWLVLFGLIHAHLLLWMGDILYLYGICGMLVYLLRNINPKYLILAVPLAALIDFGVNTAFLQYARATRIDYLEAQAAADAGTALTDAQNAAIEDWRGIEETFIPNREKAEENTRKMKSDYASVGSVVRKQAVMLELLVPLVIWDSLALMLLGLALYRWGFLSGQWSNRSYWKVILIGYGIGLPLAIYSHYYGYLHSPNREAILQRLVEVRIQWVGLIYPFQRILLVMAHASVIVLLYKSGALKGLFRRLEAVGQMAFTNYIMHTVFCTLIFFGYGLNYYAELQYYQLYFVVLGIWILQLIVSPLWLRYFRFGPLEWLWRSLTYWRWQPFRREAKAESAAADSGPPGS